MTDLLVSNGRPTIATQHWPGNDRPLLLIHGPGGTLDTRATMVPHLSPTFRVLAMDLRSHGLSEPEL
jgi:pimeloyl-ACP methyl ester carboxylesterase